MSKLRSMGLCLLRLIAAASLAACGSSGSDDSSGSTGGSGIREEDVLGRLVERVRRQRLARPDAARAGGADGEGPLKSRSRRGSSGAVSRS